MNLQQIGLGHPRIRQVMAIEKNTAPNPRKLFIAEGLWAHKLLLSTRSPVEVFFWSPEAAYGDEARLRATEIAAVAKAAYQISAKTLERISERDRPDGLLSIAQLQEWRPEDIEFGPSALVMVADGMEIPGNLGTLIRTADACRVDCIVLTNRQTRLTHPKVFRASQGMMLTVPIIEFGQPEEAADWLQENEFDVYLADTDDARNYRSLRYRGRRTAFVLGAERYGIPKAWYRPDFQRVFVPMLGTADSLNVSISAAVLLYEARAQKEKWLGADSVTEDSSHAAGLRQARSYLRDADPVLARLIDDRPDFDPRAWLTQLPPMDLYGALLFQVTGQQLSVAATRRTLARIEALFGGRLPAPAELLGVDPGQLRGPRAGPHSSPARRQVTEVRQRRPGHLPRLRTGPARAELPRHRPPGTDHARYRAVCGIPLEDGVDLRRHRSRRRRPGGAEALLLRIPGHRAGVRIEVMRTSIATIRGRARKKGWARRRPG